MQLRILRLFITSVLFTGFFYCSGQDIDIKWSAEETYPVKSPEPVLLGSDEEYLYVYKGLAYGELKYYYIEVVNKKDLTVARKIKLDATTLPTASEHTLSRAFFDGDEFFFFTDLEEGDTRKLFGSILDKKGKTIVEGKLIEEIDNSGKKYKGYIEVISDNNTNDFLIFTDVPTEKRDNEQIKYKLIDNTFKELAQNQLTLPYTEREFEILNTFIDAKTTVYLVGSKKDKSAPSGKQSVLFYFSLANGAYGELQLPLNNTVNSGINFQFDENDNIIVTGLYTTNSKRTKYKEGLFYAKFENGTGKVLDSRTTKFDVSRLTNLSRNYVLDNAISDNFSIRHIYNLDKGEKIFILEQGRNELVQSNSKVTLFCYRSHMLVVKVDEKGNQLWMSVVPKDQKIKIPQSTVVFFVPINQAEKYDKMQSLLSYTAILKDKNLYLLYNDHIKNIRTENLSKIKTTKLKSSTACYMATIDENGKVTRKIMFNSDEQGYWITPDNSEQINEEEVVLFSYLIKQKKAKMGIMQLH